MGERYISIAGSPISLASAPVQDFIADVTIAGSIFDAEGPSVNGLAEHTQELNQIAENLVAEVSGGELKDNSRSIWGGLIDLSHPATEHSNDYMASYSRLRIFKLLNVEFGPAKTTTTDALVHIANETVRERITGKSGFVVKSFFENGFSRTVMEAIYPESGDGSITLHPTLDPILDSLDSESARFDDPALARIVTTLTMRGVFVPFLTRKRLFRATAKMNTHSKKGHPASQANNSVPPDTGNSEQQTGEEEYLTIDILPKKPKDFNRRLGNCVTGKDKDLHPSLREALTASMVRTMFPNDGIGTSEAIKVCKNCPIDEACLNFALENRIQHGVWGGVSERGRRDILKARNTAVKVSA